jgi:EAL domain-containing protein (putative c-di-GMP-specific phosphodiesterase class I)
MQLAIDDFGTGYSSLAYLAKLPAPALKIDRAFITTMLDEPNNMTLVSMMISLAHSLRMKVIAEGVETEEQAKMLRLLRCDQIQGYLVGRPFALRADVGIDQASSRLGPPVRGDCEFTRGSRSFVLLMTRRCHVALPRVLR